jgi:hypothetical protein
MQISALMSKSHSDSETKSAAVSFGVNLNRDSVFLSSEVRDSYIFAKAMLALGGVVKFTSEFRKKDHSQYQAWVQDQYLREAGPEMAIQNASIKAAQEKLVELRQEQIQLDTFLDSVMNQLDKLDVNRDQYWDWLYDNNRELWMILDPIVSVQEKSTFFEAFSLDESTYVRVELPHTELIDKAGLRKGTTNIDFGLHLEREFERVRTYRPLTLTVGQHEVGVATEVSQAVEKKIDLPESWIQGLVQVAAAQTLRATEIELHPMFVSQVIAKLGSIREKTGPRSLRFMLFPGEPVKVVIEPWGFELVDYSSTYMGEEAVEIRIWGRRRLRLLANLLPHASKVNVNLLGDGMPSFWSVVAGEITTTFGFSGWNSLDWSKKMQFSALLPSQKFDQTVLDQALDLLIQSQSLDSDTVAGRLNVSPAEAKTILQTLAFHGKAMFLPSENLFVYRELVPGWQPDPKAGIEERRGKELANKNDYFTTLDNSIENAEFVVSGRTDDGVNVVIHRDSDGRIVYAQCSCSYFAYNRLRLGPCRHIVAIGLK